MPVPSGMQWTREYLRKKGVPNQDITWNPQTSAVSVYGQELKPQYGENGMSYASTANLDKFFSSLQPTFRTNQLMGQIDQLRNFQYNPQTDPSFQQAQKGITRNVMNTMQDRGLLLSTQTPERIAQATAEAIPQFESAATQRNQQNLQNLFSLVQTIQQQQQAADEAKRQEQYTALNQLNTLAGLTGAIPDVGAQFGLTPGALTASERARRQSAAGSPASPMQQLIDMAATRIAQGQGTPEDWALIGRQTPGQGPDTKALQSEWLNLAKFVSDPFADANAKRYAAQRMAEIQTQLQQASSQGAAVNPMITGGADPWPQWIKEGKDAGKTDEEMRQIMRQNGVDPEKYLPLPKKSRTIQGGGYPVSGTVPSTTSAYPVGGGRTSYNP